MHCQGLQFFVHTALKPFTLQKKPGEQIFKSFHFLRGKAYDPTEEIQELEALAHANATKDTRFIHLFSKEFIHPLIVGVGLNILQQITGINATIFFSGAIFAMAGVDSNAASIIMAAVQVGATVISCIMLEK